MLRASLHSFPSVSSAVSVFAATALGPMGRWPRFLVHHLGVSPDMFIAMRF